MTAREGASAMMRRDARLLGARSAMPIARVEKMTTALTGQRYGERRYPSQRDAASSVER